MSHIGIVYWSLPALHASRPMRARELKQGYANTLARSFRSRPMRARELKLVIESLVVIVFLSRPHAGA